MYSIYHYEIESYKEQLNQIESTIDGFFQDRENKNLTHFSLASSNRCNFLVVGLCGLVEARLFEIAKDQDELETSKLRGGLGRLVNLLKKVDAINFGELRYWDSFYSISRIRNSIVHGYGGLVLDEAPKKIRIHLDQLGLASSLVGDRRIRLGPKAVKKVIKVVDKLLDELGAYVT